MNLIVLSSFASIQNIDAEWYVNSKNRTFKINETIATILSKFESPRFLKDVIDETLLNSKNKVESDLLKKVENFIDELIKIGVLTLFDQAKLEIPNPVFEISKTYNQYRIDEYIAVDNKYIQIFKAYNLERKKKVVLKLFAHKINLVSNDQKINQSFAVFNQEIKISQLVSKNKNVCHFHQKGIHDDYLFFEIDFIAGLTLSKKIKSKNFLRKDKNNIALQLLNALAYLHKKNIVHGDIHGKNFMVTPRNKVFLIDFGFSYDGNKNAEKQFYNKGGVTHYMPPERVNVHSYNFSNAIATKKSEVYQMGLILYTLYKGKNPFMKNQETTWREMANDILTRAFPEKIAVNKSVDAIIRKALQIQPDNRYASCIEMYTDFLKTVKF